VVVVVAVAAGGAATVVTAVVWVGAVVVCVVSVTAGAGVGAGGETTDSGAGGGASSCCSPKARFASAWFVNVASGLNVVGVFVPIKPALVTVRISATAHEPERWADATASPHGTSASNAAATAILGPTAPRIGPSGWGL